MSKSALDMSNGVKRLMFICAVHRMTKPLIFYRDTGRGSDSCLQRLFTIGYSLAARLFDTMVRHGILSCALSIGRHETLEQARQLTG